MGRLLSHPTGITRQCLLAVAFGLAAASCSSSSPVASTTTVGDSADTTAPIVAETIPPATRAKPNPSASFDDWQIGWVNMDEDSVEVEWQPAESNATYDLFRVLSIESDPITVTVDDSNLVYSGSDVRFIDESVDPDTFYTYIVTLTSDRADRRWTDTLTTTDVTAPSPIVGLFAEVSEDGVELGWEPSSDDVEFASYAVSIVGDDGELTYIGGGADEGATTFVDTEWSGAPTTYVVQAVDFHNNRTEPVEVVVN